MRAVSRARLHGLSTLYAKSYDLLKNVKINLSGEDIREGMTGVISVKVPDPQFEGQTKQKLGNTEVEGIVQTLVNEKLKDYLEENPNIAKRVIQKSIQAAQARDAASKGTGSHPPEGDIGFSVDARKTCRLFRA